MKRLLVLLAAIGAVLLVAVPAYADAVSDAASKLSPQNRVYVAPNAEVKVASDALDGSKVNMVVAALPASAGDPGKAAGEIGQRIFKSKPGVVIVISGTTANGVTNIDAAKNAVNAAGVTADNEHPLSRGGDATPFVKSLVASINEAAPKGTGGGSSSSGSSDSGGGSHTGLIVGLVIAVLVVGGAGAWFMTKRRRKQQHLADRRSEVISYYDRLGADVQNLDPGTDAVARQALADASERYTATGSQLEQAQSDAQFDSARRTALEGLQAAQTARRRLGLDPGPELPPIAPTRGERLTQEQEIKVGDRTVRGYPDYTPGAPYYFGGGGGYGAGWYSFPFWETLLIGSVLSGGLGGWGGGGFESGYDSGYDRGFEAGEDQANNDQNDNSGDWGNGGDDWSSGGDWGGGSDWGSDGGGDWGGGGDGGW